MTSSQNSKEKELGKAIARGIAQENAQKELNLEKARKRNETMLKKAAESIFRDFSA